MTWPRITNETHIMTTAMAKPAEDAFRTALSEMVLWLEESYGFQRGEALPLPGPGAGGALHPVRQPDFLVRGQGKQEVPAVIVQRRPAALG